LSDSIILSIFSLKGDVGFGSKFGADGKPTIEPFKKRESIWMVRNA